MDSSWFPQREAGREESEVLIELAVLLKSIFPDLSLSLRLCASLSLSLRSCAHSFPLPLQPGSEVVPGFLTLSVYYLSLACLNPDYAFQKSLSQTLNSWIEWTISFLLGHWFKGKSQNLSPSLSDQRLALFITTLNFIQAKDTDVLVNSEFLFLMWIMVTSTKMLVISVNHSWVLMVYQMSLININFFKPQYKAMR